MKIKPVLKIIITLLIISPVALFLFGSVLYPRPKIIPPQNLIGEWGTTYKSPFGDVTVNLSLNEDGTVEGMIGNATMHDAFFRRNSSRLVQMVGLGGAEHIITGNLQGSVVNGVECAEFYVLGPRGKDFGSDTFCRKCQKDGQPVPRFYLGPVWYRRVEKPEN